ncbi:MAG: type I DNA topoisomerase [Cytophagales bacterium]
MPKNLVIVESPAKAKTIEKYLGEEFKVASSYGHVRDLPKGDKAIDIKNGFKPTYEVTKDKKDVIKELKRLSKDAETIYLASDDDREGEAISWHLKETLNLDDKKTRRIVFREITKNAILNALQNPRGIDNNLVDAQQARRILDRLVGYELSPILWKKIKRGLSAGRVQSVAVRLVVEREREIENFKAESNYKTDAYFSTAKGNFTAVFNKRYKSSEDVQKLLENCLNSDFTVFDVETKPGKRTPSPPFTTSTLQQEASRKLGFSVAQTMTIAQKLYEAGHITYMRTDSLNLSQEAIQSASSAIKSNYGDEYIQNRNFKTKSGTAQEAHEAIRPTDFNKQNAGADRNAEKLYELIWKRAVASQMADAKIEKTTAKIEISEVDRSEYFEAKGEVIKFDGFLKVYIEGTDDEDAENDNSVLPPLEKNQKLDLNKIISKERFSRHAPRYTEASLVKKLEEKGIGRPSTYAPTISTIQKRDYVVKESRIGKDRDYQELSLENGKIESKTKTENTGAEKNKLFPTNIAMVVNDFLVEHFERILDYDFTAEVEKEFDEIAQGNKEWEQMLSKFYGGFHSHVEQTESIDRKDVKSSRDLGTDPKSGRKVLVRLGRFGPLAQIGEADDESGEKPRYAGLRNGQFIESITLEEALELFKLPRKVGEYEGEEISANIGRFGPYVVHKKKFASIPKDEDPYTIEESRAIELIDEKRKADAEKFIKTFDENPDVQVLKGKYGPYIKVGRKNVKIPKDKEPSSLSLEECLELAENAPAKGKKKNG